MDNPNTNRATQRDINCLVRHFPKIDVENINTPTTWDEFLLLTKREKALILQKFFEVVTKVDGTELSLIPFRI